MKHYLYAVEWQKLGLPHLHILLWFLETINPNDIDKIIFAEIPDKNDDPLLHDLVIRNMIHGPCGKHNIQCPCMKNNKCSKQFPKNFTKYTQVGNDGYPQYKRRDKANGGNVGFIRMKQNEIWTDFEIDNK